MKKARIALSTIAISILVFSIMYVWITDRVFTPIASKATLTVVLVLIEISILLGIIEKHQRHDPISVQVGILIGILILIFQ